MDMPQPAAPAGWYPGPDGLQRYWDGQQWLEIPAPEIVPTTPDPTPPAGGGRPKRSLILAGVAVAVVVALALGGVAWKSSYDAQQAAAAVAQEVQAKEDQAAKDKQAQEDAAAAAKSAQDATDQEERENRQETVKKIEKSIKTMAKKHVKDHIIDGPIISVSCDPVSGGSLDDLTEVTTAFQCFVADKDNKDGTLSGYYYHATMNWDTGSFTYGYGQP
jgi:hypothetical protein